MVQTLIDTRPPAVDPGVLAAVLRPIVAGARDQAELDRRLPAAAADALRAAGAFRLTLPAVLGGSEASLSAQVTLYEALGRVDGPVAWNVWNGNTGFAAALLDPTSAAEIWHAGPDLVVANSARVGGTARPDGDRFVISGRWDIVSAIDIADWVVLFAVVEGTVVGAPDGPPDLRACFLPVAEVEVLDTWHTTGMRGTGSNTVLAHEVAIPQRWAVSPFAPAQIDSWVYRIPAFTIASTGSAPIVVGMAQAAIDAVVALAPGKPTDNGQLLSERPHAQERLGQMSTALHGARLALSDAAADIDRAALDGREVDERLRGRLRSAMSHAAAVSRDVFLGCQRLASSSALYTGAPVERIVRDGMAAAQHTLLAESHFQIAGRHLCGLDSGAPVV